MKVWNSKDKEENQLKEVAIDLRGNCLVAVDAETGEFLVYLYDFENMRTFYRADYGLKEEGYRTDFAEWDDRGRMTKLLEPFD